LKLKGSRVLQSYQAYSQLYYETKLKPVIDKKYHDYLETVPPKDQKSAFAFRAAETKRLFDAETDEVKKQVEEYRKMKVSDMAIKIDNTDVQDEASQAELATAMQS
jgi:hypothetical protein